MALLKQFKENLYVTIQDTIIVYNVTTGSYKKQKLPEIIIPENLSKGQTEVLQREDREITSIAISDSGDHILLSTQNKQIVAFDSNFTVLNNFVLNRAASKVRFSPENNILIADKTGDAYLTKLKENDPQLILGHLSMLLDVLITPSNKFIITSDRDEKIRVSHYPNSYNILSYCLGHKEFVTNVELSKDILISASGDGTLGFWDYKTGKQEFLVDTNELIKDKVAIEEFCNKMDKDNVEVKALPVTDLQIYEDGNKTFIAVTLLNLDLIQIFTMSLNCNKKVYVEHTQTILIDKPIVSFSLGQCLYILSMDGISMYSMVDYKFSLRSCEKLVRFYGSCKDSFGRCVREGDVSVLYKRKYDNVQEYLERKKLRLEAK